MKRKILLAFMVIMLSIFTFGIINASASVDGIYIYSVLNGKATVVYCSAAIGDITIPDTLGGYPVTSIDNEAFYDCSNLTSITIPDSVTSIGDCAFSYCTSLASITIPDSVTSIGNSAFSACTSLTSITIPDSVTSISENTFDGCESLTSVIIGNGVESIGENAFYFCESLTNITIPDSVTSIGEYAFYRCTSLTSVTIGNGVTNIDAGAFNRCDSLTSVNITDIKAWCNIDFAYSESNPLYYAKNIYLNGNLVTNLEIPDGVTSIADYAFGNCTNLTDITISDSVTSIGNDVFDGCTSLTSITIGNGVTSIGDYAFNACTSLTSVNITDIKAWCNINFYGAYSNPLYHAGNLYLNGNLVTNLEIPDSVTSIGNNAFRNCTNLTDITIPDSVTSIGNYAFNGCTGLTSVTIGNGVTSIGGLTFSECVNLTSITIGNGVKKIGTYAFNSCFKLSTVYYNGTQKEWDAIDGYDWFLENATKKFFLYVTLIDETGNIISKKVYDANTLIDISDVEEKTEYSIHLYNDAEYKNEYILTTPISQNLTLYLRYVPNYHTYKFIDENGDVLKEEKAGHGAVIEAPQNPADKDPYTFDYWEGYLNGMILTDDISFRAVYKYKDYTITSEGLSDVITVTYNDNFSINPQLKDGYSFIGYFTEKDGKGTQITNEKGESLNVYNVVGDLKVYPYFCSNYMNKAELQCVETAMPGDTITQSVTFATDKNVMYFMATVKYPKYLNIKSIKGVDFTEATKEAEKVVGDYKYSNITCIFDYEGNFIEKNKNYVPFELEFEVATDAPTGNAEIIIENVALVGDDYYNIADVNNSTLTIQPKLVQSIEIIGNSEVDAITKFNAIILPDYTTDKSVVWSVDDESVATITQDGTLTPIKNGTVVITVTAKDGSRVFATKTVNVFAYAKINSLDFGDGVVLCEFNSDVRKYTVYVKENTTSISLTPTFSGGVLRPNGSGLWASGIPKNFELQQDGVTTITLNRELVNNMTNSVYTVEVIKFEGTKTEVSEDKKSFTITPINIEIGKTVILALYNGEQFVEMESAIYTGEAIPFTTTNPYTKAKVMVWDDLTTLKPVCNAEELN